jgi:hypothetical protein
MHPELLYNLTLLLDPDNDWANGYSNHEKAESVDILLIIH